MPNRFLAGVAALLLAPSLAFAATLRRGLR